MLTKNAFSIFWDMRFFIETGSDCKIRKPDIISRAFY